MSLVIKPQIPPSQDVNDNFNLGKLLGELLDHYKIIAIITVVFTCAALLYALFATPIYQANALIQIEQKQGNALLSNLSQMLPDSQPQSAPEMTLLQSRSILGKTVDDLHLQTEIEPDYLPLIGLPLAKIAGKKAGQITISQLSMPTNETDSAQAVLSVINKEQYRLKGDGFDLQGRRGELLNKEGVLINVSKINAEPGESFVITWNTRLEAISLLQESFSVADQGKDTGMLVLTLTGEDPQKIKTVLDSISANYLAQNIARQAAQDAKSLDFLNEQLPSIRSDLDVAEGKLNEYRKQKDSVDLNMEAKSVLDQIVNVDNQLNELTFREAEVSQLYKKDHPTYRALLEKRETLQAERQKLNKRVSGMPSTQQEVLRLSRDVDSGRAVYLQLLSRQQELSVAKSSAIGNVRIIDDAVSLTRPVKPKKMLIVLIGLLSGLFISFGLVMLKVTLRQGIESPEQLEELGISVYACVPYSDWLGKNNTKGKKNASDVLLAIENPADPSVETIRGLRTTLHFAMMEAKNNILAISGVSPSSGKTFVSTNLATILAQAQKRILFIDADLRKGYTHHLLGLKENKGLSDILRGNKTFEQVVTTQPKAGFDYLSRGPVPENPAELLMQPGFEALMEKVSGLYDLIVIDTPPIMAVTDASIISKCAGTVLMVTRFEVNTVKEILASIRRFEQAGITVAGCILNGVRKKASSYYSYGYSPYGYAYNKKDK